uniref:CMP-N-acetylneuraminate-beta-1,4-galactoside alpha-2,3-sialyltransferase n=1 Tax=Chrysemys picta bellii TaxID=8478 RepID=A0A8C3FEA1_CHRPI|nr:CMP-N-acetylneuraminate-beta-1,4-galactoside alpha-2,3-sialyltransferase isoform X2 [Chrysemys picta bellii]
MKMGLLVFMRNLLLALCLFLVLGFLYYSAWKLHLLRWEDTKYDKLGFLLKLDSKLPPELASKYANFSEGVCKPGYASALMTSIFPKFSKPAPMFLDDSFKRWARIRDFVPPFGIKGQDNLIKAILSATKEYRLTPALDSLSCRRCIIVGNGGVLANKSLGLKIDDYDVVVRLNSAPVKGFEKDVGGKTTLRITYPEGAIQKLEQYEKDSFFVLAGFKWQDFKWLKYIVYKEKVSASDGFWKSVATRVPREPHEIRILNPYFIQEAAFSFIGLPFNNGLMGRGNIPTLGSVAITMALHNCDEVAVAGFGYDMNSPNAPLHYYESIKMSAIKEVSAALTSLAKDMPMPTEGDSSPGNPTDLSMDIPLGTHFETPACLRDRPLNPHAQTAEWAWMDGLSDSVPLGGRKRLGPGLSSVRTLLWTSSGTQQ